MDFKKVLGHYRKQPNHYVLHLWDNINKNGIKPDFLRDILMFYFQHKIFPPILQKSFDMVIMKLSERNTTKKMRNVLLQIVDEVSHCLDPSNIVDGVRMSGSGIINIHLLNCLLNNSSLPQVIDYNVFQRILSILDEPNLTTVDIEERSKALVFLTTFCPEKLRLQLSKQMADWLQFSQPLPSSTQLFFRSEVSELDGSQAISLTTVLSLSNNFSVGHITSILIFSQLRSWLSVSCVDSSSADYADLLMAALAHCSVLVDQCSKKPYSQEDGSLKTSVLCEVLDLLYLMVNLKPDLLDECCSVVKEMNVYKDVCVRIKIWKFLLSYDKSNLDDISIKMMKDCISRCFTVGSECYELVNLLLDEADKLQPELIKYHPNLFKMFATHPQTLIEEFIELVPYLATSCITDDIVEVFNRLIDLPVLSAVICIHQIPALLQAGYNDTVLDKLFHQNLSNDNIAYNHFIKTTSISQYSSQLLHLYPEFFSQIDKLCMQGLVQTCSQAAPLLLNAFLSSAILNESTAEALLPFMLSRLALIYQVPGYKEQIHSSIGEHLKTLFSIHPSLTSHECIIRFISNVKNMELCSPVYLDIIWALGEYTNKAQLLSEHFEVVECALWEVLATTDTSNIFNHLNIMVTTLAKLSCRSQDLLPRAVLSLNKVLSQSSGQDSQSSDIVALNQLASLLKNPNVASVVLAPTGEGDKTMAAMIKAITLFTGS